MIKIKTIKIETYRSIIDLKIEINNDNNFIAICGENNTEKTNTLRAIDLFFNPEKYEKDKDVPFHKLEGSRGGSISPKISINFLLEDGDIYKIERNFDLNGLKETNDQKLKIQGIRNDKEDISPDEMKKFLSKIHFFFIESIRSWGESVET